eukprot:GEMP01057822.1.p1 GENE.GEMP01057822.1~~GEMP01057822.1.p1  ORF type:complete len:224 (+),score=24.39 GEMP01057822.1:60-731(+)
MANTGPKRCRICGKDDDHYATDCPKVCRQPNAAIVSQRTCFTCGQKGHLERFCTKAGSNLKRKHLHDAPANKPAPVPLCPDFHARGDCRLNNCPFTHDTFRGRRGPRLILVGKHMPEDPADERARILTGSAGPSSSSSVPESGPVPAMDAMDATTTAEPAGISAAAPASGRETSTVLAPPTRRADARSPSPKRSAVELSESLTGEMTGRIESESLPKRINVGP